jgi:hypothetical protein
MTPKNIILLTLGIGALLLTGCSTIAVDRPPPAAHAEPPVILNLCLLKDQGVSCQQAETIIAALSADMAVHGIAIHVPWIRDWQRAAFFETGITRAIAATPLEAPCDRILALVGRNLGDFAWGLLMPEILGAVEVLTRTKGYAVAETGSLNQVLSLHSPADGAIHEFYHMLGCDHGDSAQACAAHIDTVKKQARQNHSDGNTFFPGIDPAGQPLFTRAAVASAFEGYLPQAAPVATLSAPPMVCE